MSKADATPAKRPLRVLHIGNIANNAYNNAKIQRRWGIEADVLCFDYYHIMACPEWEDADFAGEIDEPDFPDWWRVNLRGFRRPRWFAQGPMDACIRYLLARTARARSADFLWRWLTFERWMLTRRGKFRHAIAIVVERVTGRKIHYVGGPANAILLKLAASGALRVARAVAPVSRRLSERIARRALRWRRFGRTADIQLDRPRQERRRRGQEERVRSRIEDEAGAISDPGGLDRYLQLWLHPYTAVLLRRYDVIQAYGTYSGLPYIADHQPYVAYEHGTIRNIPFETNAEGRLCLASYRAAQKVFVTNVDNMAAAERMGVAGKVVPLPHAFDSDKLAAFADNWKGERAAERTLFFMPSRQHWVDSDPGWAKGNDRALHALAAVRKSGRTCLLQLVDWGDDTAATRALAEDLGLTDMIAWCLPMRKRQLWQVYMCSDAVLDQFVTPSIGGVAFEAMMLGRRVLTRIDQENFSAFFGAPPPLHDCTTADDIAAAMADIIDDRADLGGRGAANRKWMEERHSAAQIVRLQQEVYDAIVRARPHAF